MTQRTIREAEAFLDELSGVSDAERRTLHAEVDQAKATAQVTATSAIDGRYAELQTAGTATFDGYVSIKEEAANLIAEIGAGRVDGADARERLNDLLRRHRAATAQRGDFEEGVRFVADVEADPVAFADSLHERFPSTRPEFSL